jgi:2-hydroxychromene-2-carboxylate isomerase
MPFVAQAITSNKTRNLKRAWFELTRYLLPSRNTVTFFHKVDDPYSYLLLQAMPRLEQDFKIRINVQFVLDLPPEGTPEPHKLQSYALKDCERLAEFHDLSFPDNPQQPSAANAFAASALLVKHRDSPKLLHLMLEVTGALWKDSTTTFESCIKRYGTAPEKDARAALENAVDTLQRMGHYNSAMLHYGNEWYWGLDRLGHLAERLNRPSLRRSHEDVADYQRQYRHVLQSYNTLKPRPRQLKPMEFYFSFRSPYSYLAAGRLFKLQDLYQFPLSLRPVMPMVTRGIPLPPEKKMYILKDAKREAQRFNIPFGRISDPLGDGVDRCMALFPWAQSQGKAKDYILSVMTGIWAEGANVSDDGTLKKLVERAGLVWDEAEKELANERWKSLVELNRKDLESLGLWGVPTIRYGDLVVWGQDRLWAIEQEMLLNRNGKA